MYRSLTRPGSLSLGANGETSAPSIVAVFHGVDGTRVELAVRDAVDAYVCDGPRIDRDVLLISTPNVEGPIVELVRVDELRSLVGASEVLTALELYTAGRLKDAARHVEAAGPRWAALVDLLGGPA